MIEMLMLMTVMTILVGDIISKYQGSQYNQQQTEGSATQKNAFKEGEKCLGTSLERSDKPLFYVQGLKS